MEGLIFFIAMAVFIARIVKKINKAASGNKKAGPSPGNAPAPLKDKLEELIKRMEEAERLKNEKSDVEEEVLNSADSQVEAEDGGEEASEVFSAGDRRFQKGKTRKPVFKYDENIDFSEKDYRKDNLEGYSDERIDEKKKLKSYFTEKERKSAGKRNTGSLSAVKKVSSSGQKRKRGGILDMLSRYPDIQKAVILKEILDKPVSEKI